jgi:argininosuccinate lyase
MGISDTIAKNVVNKIEPAIIEQIKKAQDENKAIMLKKMEDLYSIIEEVIDKKVHEKCQQMMLTLSR